MKLIKTANLSINFLAETTLNQKDRHEVDMSVKSKRPIL